MGCPCGCEDVAEDQAMGSAEAELRDLFMGLMQPERTEADTLYDRAIEAVGMAMAAAFEEGFRTGSTAMADVAEITIQEDGADPGDEPDSLLADMVEADAVALDSVLMEVQDLRMRLEALEMASGLKYLG